MTTKARMPCRENQRVAAMPLTAELATRLSVADYRALLSQSANQKGRYTKPRKTPEEDLHRECFHWIECLTPQYPILQWLFHYPAGELRKKGIAGKLKAMGVRAGIPDFLLPRRCGKWLGLAVELKSPTGKLRQSQSEWLDTFREEGYLTAVCRTLEDFQRVTEKFLLSDQDIQSE